MSSNEKSVLLLSTAYDEETTSTELNGAPTTGIARLAQEIRNRVGVKVILDPRAGAGIPFEKGGEYILKLIDELGDQLLAVGIQLPFSESIALNPRGHLTDYQSIDALISLIRSKGIPLILGGNAITLDAEGTLGRMRERVGECLDGTVAVSGEADLVLPDLLGKDPEAWQDDPRLYRLVNGQTLPGRMQLLTNEELHNLAPLRDPAVIGFEATGRGCKQNCTFCAIPGLSGGPKSMRSFEPHQFVHHVQFFIESGKIGVGTTDADLFDVGIEWWKEVLALSEKAGLLNDLRAFIFSGYTNAFRLKIKGGLGLEELEILKKLGFRDLGLGVQSMEPAVLKSVHRPSVDPTTLWRFFTQCQDSGISVSPDMILGLPGHTESSLKTDIFNMLVMTLHGAQARPAFFYQHRRGSQTFNAPIPAPVSQEIIDQHDKVFSLSSTLDAVRLNSRAPEEIRRFFPNSILEAPIVTPQEIQGLSGSLDILSSSGSVPLAMIERLRGDAQRLLDQSEVIAKWKRDIEVERDCLADLEGDLSPSVYQSLSIPWEKNSHLQRRIAEYQRRQRM
ncbi:MAG: radical SAM protein [Patescibacteria group bacterium]